MLIIRAEQMRILEREIRVRYVKDLAAHVRTQLPNRCSAFTQRELCLIVAVAITNSQAYGFRTGIEVVQFVYLQIVLGLTFESDDAYAPVCRLLQATGLPIQERLDRIWEWVFEKILAVRAPYTLTIPPPGDHANV